MQVHTWVQPTTGHYWAADMGRGYLQPGLLLLTLAALQNPPPVQNGFFQGQSFTDYIQELEDTQIINLKASNKTVKYKKLLHTARQVKSNGLIV